MINFKNSLKKALAGAFGVITMLSPLQSCQCVDYYTYIDIARENGLDVETLPDYEIAALKLQAEKYNKELDPTIKSAIEAYKTLILEPDNQINKNNLRRIKRELGDRELSRLALGHAISSIIYKETSDIGVILSYYEEDSKHTFRAKIRDRSEKEMFDRYFLLCVCGEYDTRAYPAKYDTQVCPVELQRRLDKAENNIEKLIDFICNTINNYPLRVRDQIFFNRYTFHGPLNLLRPLIRSCDECKNNPRFDSLIRSLLELVADIYEHREQEIDLDE